MNLTDLGIATCHTQNMDLDKKGFSVARIIEVNKESYIISDGKHEYFAKLTGNMLYSSDSPEDFPSVGDFVLYQSFEDDSLAIIHDILPRKSLLKRKSAGKKIDYQLIAANVDFAIIIQSLDSDLNTNRLERYLAMANEFGIEPIIFFSKSDLISEEERMKIVLKIKSNIPDTKIVTFSNFDEKSKENIKTLLLKQKTYCLIGSSGVGKTSLLNSLIGRHEFKTREVRENDSKGKHATTNRHLVVLENGAIIIDTPGMRELGNISISEGIDKTFDEIVGLGKFCQFSDCSHINEKGCAILEALKMGEIEEKRYYNFIKMKKETNYYERSYLEKKQRDKKFGKMIKSVMKHNKKK